MQERKWHFIPANGEQVSRLKETLGINEKLCEILVQLGITDFKESKHFFRPQLEDLHDPFLMKDMDKAVARILQAQETGEKILVYGDYDVDGTTSVALVYDALQNIISPEFLHYYIPNRYREGYGVSQAGIEYAAANNFSLIICLDCGIKSVEHIAYANTLNIDFIVCDHHLPGAELPPAIAILNVKQPGCMYPYKELSGCGVGFKLMSALYKQVGIDFSELQNYLCLVVTAIAADIVPLTGENRTLAFFGLKEINENPLPGLHALLTLAAVKQPVTISHLVFAVSPRINAAGRMDDANKVVKLLTEKNPEKVMDYAGSLQNDNAERKDVDVAITEMALEMIKQDADHAQNKSTVLFHKDWHKGVVGIVASRVIEHYYRPTILLTEANGLATGSARSVHDFNLYEAIYACRQHLLNFGGHFAAAGVTMLPSAVAAFRNQFETVVAQTIKEDSLQPRIEINTIIAFSEINPGFFNIIKQMEPFGPHNMRPVFLSTNVKNNGWSKIVKEKHIRFVVEQNNLTMSGIGFNLAHKFDLLHTGKDADIVYTIEENSWNGNVSLQLKVIDIRASV